MGFGGPGRVGLGGNSLQPIQAAGAQQQTRSFNAKSPCRAVPNPLEAPVISTHLFFSSDFMPHEYKMRALEGSTFCRNFVHDF